MVKAKFNLAELVANSIKVDMLTVLSFEMNVYLVELTVGKDKGLVYQDDKPKRFHNSQNIRDAFTGIIVEAAQMLHESPYDEMIGNPESVQKASMLPFSMRQPY